MLDRLDARGRVERRASRAGRCARRECRARFSTVTKYAEVPPAPRNAFISGARDIDEAASLDVRKMTVASSLKPRDEEGVVVTLPDLNTCARARAAARARFDMPGQGPRVRARSSPRARPARIHPVARDASISARHLRALVAPLAPRPRVTPAPLLA